MISVHFAIRPDSGALVLKVDRYATGLYSYRPEVSSRRCNQDERGLSDMRSHNRFRILWLSCKGQRKLRSEMSIASAWKAASE